ncbi:hypothetical protein MRX96_020926 [Rhipicephalus microplus]
MGLAMNSIEEEVDTVVFATGFKADLSFPTDALPQKGERFLLYKMMAFEMQARYRALILSGKLCLPPRKEMKEDIEATQNRISSLIPTARHALMIDWVSYVDDLAGIIGKHFTAGIVSCVAVATPSAWYLGVL